eukprot:CAMPEP_0117422240 /NCGR_PEP_ID=MMETSP0758-20121206/3122_1 /TAXON_ID=63605 /ORGANISM="Percolomonas cosmopolitus, Strain AE-1 (ATCC 50343)" /LENGTH=120 /DNA_ID=CAMNT_0005204747 /DNA_START=785 /DNA_END=1144 /DNA_ORIENTATION=-
MLIKDAFDTLEHLEYDLSKWTKEKLLKLQYIDQNLYQQIENYRFSPPTSHISEEDKLQHQKLLILFKKMFHGENYMVHARNVLDGTWNDPTPLTTFQKTIVDALLEKINDPETSAYLIQQ